jgi:hypothetical protein
MTVTVLAGRIAGGMYDRTTLGKVGEEEFLIDGVIFEWIFWFSSPATRLGRTVGDDLGMVAVEDGGPLMAATVVTFDECRECKISGATDSVVVDAT